MRTRLDEIIEEALGKDAILDIHAYAAAKLIARGAFRHGVEQTRAMPNLEYRGIPWIFDVHPAPAAEKPSRVGDGHPYKPPVGICAVDGCGVAAYMHEPPPEKGWFRCDKKHTHDWGCAIDRRVGQRRNRFSAWWSGNSAVGPLYYAPINHRGNGSLPDATTEECAYFKDRRSGNDRRKP